VAGVFCPYLHQTDNLAKLRKDKLFLPELIAKIGCTVVVAITNAVYGNKCFVAITAMPFEQLVAR